MYKKLTILFCLFKFLIIALPVMAQSANDDAFEKALQSFNKNEF